MAKQRITVELADETVRRLSTLGAPAEVLEQLARAAVENVSRSVHGRREDTDTSLRVERGKADDAIEARVDLALEREATDTNLSGERVSLDAMIVDQREANEQMVAATIRAGELTEEAAAAKDRAEESEQELRAVAEFREMFIGVLGHDLRNPLSSIVMAAGSMLRRGKLDEQDRDTVGRILRASQRIGRMITQLLDLTRARLGGGLQIEAKPTDLREVCRNIVDEFESRVDLQVEGDLTGTWDADRLAEVLSNLAGNALEYATPKTVVSVRARAEGEGVVVEVINEGPPIPREQLPVLFEPFRRAKARAKSATGNLGLGLYIARQIVLAHGGTLEARSGNGWTTFAIHLPRHAPSAD